MQAADQELTVSNSHHSKSMPDVVGCLGGELKLIILAPLNVTLQGSDPNSVQLLQLCCKLIQ